MLSSIGGAAVAVRGKVGRAWHFNGSRTGIDAPAFPDLRGLSEFTPTTRMINTGGHSSKHTGVFPNNTNNTRILV